MGGKVYIFNLVEEEVGSKMYKGYESLARSFLF